MRLVVGQRTISFDWFPVAFFISTVIFMAEIGQVLLHGPAEDNENPEEGPRKMIVGILLLYTVARFKRLPPFLRNLFYIVMGYIFIMAMESFYKYGTFFIYPHVFGKFFVIFSATAIYIAFRGAKEWVYTATLMAIFTVFIIDLVVHYPEVFSIGSFMEIERGLHASQVMWIMCLWLYCFNTYMPTLKPQWLILFFVLSALILFLNHRTVWLASITTMCLNLVMINVKGKERYSSTAWTPLIVVPVIAIMLVFAYVFSEKPEFLQNITDRVVDIEKADEQGTGKWRIDQFKSYLPYVFDHPFFGMRFDGFELPVQFIAQQTGKEVFQADTGHHFHSYYMDSLFYHGLLGLSILSSIFIYTFYRLLTFPVKPTLRIVGLGVWAIICLQYGLSYPLDDYHFAMAGMALAAMDTFLDKVDKERAEEARRMALYGPPEEELEPSPEPEGVPALV